MSSTHLTVLANLASIPLNKQLTEAGWKIVVGKSDMAASAMTDCANKQIIVHPRIAKRKYKRDYKYVIPHEMGHARDCMTGWPSKFLPKMLPQGTTPSTVFDYKETREMVAERVAMILARNDRLFLSWLRVSLNFHKKHANQVYGLKQIKHPAVTELAYMLLDKSQGGTYFKFVDKGIMPAKWPM